MQSPIRAGPLSTSARPGLRSCVTLDKQAGPSLLPARNIYWLAMAPRPHAGAAAARRQGASRARRIASGMDLWRADPRSWSRNPISVNSPPMVFSVATEPKAGSGRLSVMPSTSISRQSMVRTGGFCRCGLWRVANTMNLRTCRQRLSPPSNRPLPRVDISTVTSATSSDSSDVIAEFQASMSSRSWTGLSCQITCLRSRISTGWPQTGQVEKCSPSLGE